MLQYIIVMLKEKTIMLNKILSKLNLNQSSTKTINEPKKFIDCQPIKTLTKDEYIKNDKN